MEQSVWNNPCGTYRLLRAGSGIRLERIGSIETSRVVGRSVRYFVSHLLWRLYWVSFESVANRGALCCVSKGVDLQNLALLEWRIYIPLLSLWREGEWRCGRIGVWGNTRRFTRGCAPAKARTPTELQCVPPGLKLARLPSPGCTARVRTAILLMLMFRCPRVRSANSGWDRRPKSGGITTTRRSTRSRTSRSCGGEGAAGCNYVQCSLALWNLQGRLHCELWRCEDEPEFASLFGSVSWNRSTISLLSPLWSTHLQDLQLQLPTTRHEGEACRRREPALQTFRSGVEYWNPNFCLNYEIVYTFFRQSVGTRRWTERQLVQ